MNKELSFLIIKKKWLKFLINYQNFLNENKFYFTSLIIYLSKKIKIFLNKIIKFFLKNGLITKKKIIKI
jgi:hypothetical protein